MSFWSWMIPVALTILFGAPPLLEMWSRRRSHIRHLWVRLDPVWENGVLNGGWLILTNASAWPVWNVLVMAPKEIHGTDFESVGPGEVRRLFVPEQRMASTNENVVTIQVHDIKRKMWLWTPIAHTLSPIPPRIPLLAKIIQLLVKHLTEHQQTIFHTRLLRRLPRGLVILFWGYDPMGVETEDYLEIHLRRVNENLASEHR